MRLDRRLEQAHFPTEPGATFGPRVLAAARRPPRAATKQPSLLPELFDGVGWAAAVWVGGFLLQRLLRLPY